MPRRAMNLPSTCRTAVLLIAVFAFLLLMQMMPRKSRPTNAQRAIQVQKFSNKVSAKHVRLDPNNTDPFSYLEILLALCGELCQTKAGIFEDSLYFQKRSVNVECNAIFSEEVFLTRGHNQSKAPTEIPSQYLSDFRLNSSNVAIREFYLDQMYLSKSAKTPNWTKDLIEEFRAEDNLEGTYGVSETRHLKHALSHASNINGGRVLVIGSENPWVEATVLAAGARSVVTLEYGHISSAHPMVETMTPDVFMREFHAGTLGLFDCIVTFSSVEHSGLGRYGDALNPWGDVLEIARAHCVCKSKGFLVIAVMTDRASDDVQDAIEFNAHRVYGSTRWPYLVTNWQQIYREPDGEQRVYVFQKN